MMAAVFGYGFRPFFLLAGLWSIVALLVWMVLFAAAGVLPSRFDPLSWHIHEMLFGFIMAAVAGFLLTAVANWTGRPPVSGPRLGLLVALWCAGRAACLLSALGPAWAALLVDLAFPAALLAVVAREIAGARNWRNLVVLGPVTALGLANALMHLEAAGVPLPPGVGWRFGLAAVVLLIALIGGRIVPAFTRNWLMGRSVPHAPLVSPWRDRAALAVLAFALLAWVLRPVPVSGLLLLLAAVLHFWRLSGWQGWRTVPEPLLCVLHVGYAWLVAGIGLLGLAAFGPEVPESAAVHALMAGAAGTMILAVMTRATRGHTGRALTADRATALIYVLVTVAALARVAAAFVTAWMMPLLMTAAGAWTAAFGLFLLAYGPMLLLPKPDLDRAAPLNRARHV